MKLAMLVLGVALFLAGTALAQAAQTPLTITVRGADAAAAGLDSYDPAQPLALIVNAPGEALDAVTVAATNPAGVTSTVALARAADGTYTGSLSVPDAGLWRFRVSMRTGRITTDSHDFEVNVAPPPRSDAWQIGLAVGGGSFAIVGGLGFLVVRRVVGEGAPSDRALPAA